MKLALSRKSRACALLATLTILHCAHWAIAQSFPTAVQSLNPRVYFRLNETTQPPQQLQANNLGTLGAQGNGTYFGGSPGVAGALVGSPDTAARFDGAVGIPYSPSLSLNAPFTVEAWLRPSANFNGTLCPLSCATLGANRSGWLIYQTGSSGWNLQMYSGAGSQTSVNVTAGGPLVVGRW